MEYPSDWAAIREAVCVRDRERCANCRADGTSDKLDVHHIVPRGHGGSDRMSNLILLCRQCHDAAHGKRMAPTVEFSSTGQMGNGEFEVYREFFDTVPSARFDAERSIWQIPVADMERLVEAIAAQEDTIEVEANS